MGYAGPKAISKVNMILKDKKCTIPGLPGLKSPLKEKHGALLKKGCKKRKPGALLFTVEALNKLPNDIGGKFGAIVRKEKKEKGLLQKKGCKKKYKK